MKKRPHLLLIGGLLPSVPFRVVGGIRCQRRVVLDRGRSRDGSSLLKLLAARKHAKAYFYGHTYEWQHDQRDHLHLINQPAVSYYFGKGLAHGWVDMKLTEPLADLELHCINRKHTQHGNRREIIFKAKKT
ncbi:MAG: hypothetical protein ACI9NQ_001289 [Paracoccaceae bacterium]|jgi:hypothetical protein